MQQQVKDRSNIQDMVKGALIIAVVFFHSSLFFNKNLYHEFNLVLYFFPCVMGVFFFYTGYNYTMGKRKPLDNIKRRTKQLLIPLVIMFFVSTILIGSVQLITRNTDMMGIWHSIKYFLLSNGGVIMWKADISQNNYDLLLAVGLLWYLYVLYILSVIFYLIVDWTISRIRNLIIVVLPLLFISFLMGQFIPNGYWLPYSIQSYGLFLAIMLVAAYIKKLNLLDVPLDNKKSIIVSIILMVVFEGIIIGLGLLCYFAFGATTVGALPGGSLNETIRGFDVFVAFVMAILGTYVIHTLMRFLVKIKVFSIFFGIIGKYVSLVYLTHPIFISYIHTIFGRKQILGWFQPYLYTFITIGLLVIIFVIIEILKKKKQCEKEVVINEK